MLVCHSCDVRACVNPRHLWTGTILDNVQDMDAKGRSNRITGEGHGRAKLTEADILRIRAMGAEGWSYTAIASVYGVTANNVSYIIRRKTWKHI